jgi:hypothetical protein
LKKIIILLFLFIFLLSTCYKKNNTKVITNIDALTVEMTEGIDICINILKKIKKDCPESEIEINELINNVYKKKQETLEPLKKMRNKSTFFNLISIGTEEEVENQMKIVFDKLIELEKKTYSDAMIIISPYEFETKNKYITLFKKLNN